MGSIIPERFSRSPNATLCHFAKRSGFLGIFGNGQTPQFYSCDSETLLQVSSAQFHSFRPTDCVGYSKSEKGIVKRVYKSASLTYIELTDQR